MGDGTRHSDLSLRHQQINEAKYLILQAVQEYVKTRIGDEVKKNANFVDYDNKRLVDGGRTQVKDYITRFLREHGINVYAPWDRLTGSQRIQVEAALYTNTPEGELLDKQAKRFGFKNGLADISEKLTKNGWAVFENGKLTITKDIDLAKSAQQLKAVFGEDSAIKIVENFCESSLQATMIKIAEKITEEIEEASVIRAQKSLFDNQN